MSSPVVSSIISVLAAGELTSYPGYGGRNRKCAEEFVKTRKSFSEIEKELLNGQKLQGTHTAQDVYKLLEAQNLTSEFPLFSTVYRIVYDHQPVEELTQGIIGLRPSKL